MKKIIIRLIRFYQKTLSPDHGPLSHLFPRGVCRFRPTCSDYACLALEKYGLRSGSWKAIKRLLRCNPFNPGGWDEP